MTDKPFAEALCMSSRVRPCELSVPEIQIEQSSRRKRFASGIFHTYTGNEERNTLLSAIPRIDLLSIYGGLLRVLPSPYITSLAHLYASQLDSVVSDSQEAGKLQQQQIL